VRLSSKIVYSRPKSPLGQTRKSALVTAMSAFPPIATKLRTSREVRFVLLKPQYQRYARLTLTSRQSKRSDRRPKA
jgi:hypothetical protein